jgi:hypothetical protein
LNRYSPWNSGNLAMTTLVSLGALKPATYVRVKTDR